MCFRILHGPPRPRLLAAGLLLTTRLAVGQAAPDTGQQAKPGASAEPAPSAQLRVKVPLVLEDLVVQDHDGNAVHGLKASDLTVTEDGKPVTPRNFEEHTTTQQSAAALKLPDLGPNTFTNLVANPNAESWNILLLDALNTPLADQDDVQRQMLDYLKTLTPGAPFAIFALDTRLQLLQGFTADPNLLRAAIEQREKNPHLSPLLNQTISVDQDWQMRGPKGLSDVVAGLWGVSPADAAAVRGVEAGQRANNAQRRGAGTTEALVQLGRYLAGLPGRKNLIWFSASFPVGAIPNILVQERVAVYPVDARGGVTPPPPPPPPPYFSLRYDQEVAAGLAAFQNAVLAEHTAMTNLAEETGGKAFYDTNDLKKVIESAINDGDDFYTFSYTPPEAKLDSSFRKIDMKARRPDLKLSYRTGYTAVDPNAPVRDPDSSARSALQDALRLSAPPATQILFEVQLHPEDAAVDRITAGSKPDAALMKPPYRRHELVYRVNIGDALFTASGDGSRHGSLDFAVFVYRADGALVNQTVNKIKLDLPATAYAEMNRRGLSIGQTVESPAKGDYFLRILVYDPNSDRVGAVEIPAGGVDSKLAAQEPTKNNSNGGAKQQNSSEVR